ncbi:sigma-54 dependent transcriptional regulator [soil metagenome]
MTKVLIVDDNELYRTAFRRNLMIQNYEVVEAENADEAAQVYEAQRPDLVVTDLSMRTPTEGLDVIRSIKQVDPLAPVVLISAVGTFEEGSLAKELGADRVLSKQKLEDHIEELYAAIESAKTTGVRLRALRGEIEKIASQQESVTPESTTRLREIIATNQHPVILADAYDALMLANSPENRQSAEKDSSRESAAASAEVDRILRAALPDFDKYEPATIKELRTAEYFFSREGLEKSANERDLSRNIGFSYCFAVENEAKTRLRKKLQRFLSDEANFKLIRTLIDAKTGQLDLFFHQYLLRLQQSYQFDFTVDNVRQVLQRILEHESRYKPDGLKALAIMIVCFARDYSVKSIKGITRLNNPLNLRSFPNDERTLRFAYLLVSLQHFRNPYIHPEISEMEKIPKIRETAFECLKETAKLT